MEEIKLTPQELKEAIDFGRLIGEGFFSKVFTYKGKLIKLDSILYNLLKINDPRISSDVVHDHYRWNTNDFNNRDQLEELSKRQPLIRPKVPKGIVTINEPGSKVDGISPGIIIPSFEGYKSLGEVPKTEYKRLLILLRKLFDDIRNLADHEIAQDDLFKASLIDESNNHYNIIQKGKDPQIIDMSGPLVKVGKEFKDAGEMYRQLAGLINYYYRANGLEPIYDEGRDISERQLSEMITEFDKQTRKK